MNMMKGCDQKLGIVCASAPNMSRKLLYDIMHPIRLSTTAVQGSIPRRLVSSTAAPINAAYSTNVAAIRNARVDAA